jgi:hypothetical protein
MTYTSLRLRCCVCLGLSMAFVLSGLAGPVEGAFGVYDKTERLPEMGEFTRSILVCDGREFTFLRPAGWSQLLDPAAKTVTLRSRDYGTFIALRILPNATSQREPPKADAWRQTVLGRFPRAQIEEEFPCYANNLQGLAFRLRDSTTNNLTLQRQVALIQLDHGVAEFTLTSSATQPARAGTEFGAFLGSFGIEASATPGAPTK